MARLKPSKTTALHLLQQMQRIVDDEISKSSPERDTHELVTACWCRLTGYLGFYADTTSDDHLLPGAIEKRLRK